MSGAAAARLVLALAAVLARWAGSPAWARGSSRATDLKGPYASVDDYCAKVAKRHGRRCAAEPGRWNGSVKLEGATAGLPAVRLLRLKGNEAGVPAEHCQIGIQVRDGWYFTSYEEHCQGSFGEMFSVETEARSLTWAEGASEPTFVLTTRRIQGHTEYQEGSDGRRRKISARDEVGRARVCTVPAAGPPRCSVEYQVGCHDERHRWRQAHGSVEGGALTFDRAERATCSFGPRLGTPVLDD